MNNSELKHWGIFGMKWGVRRYRNRDGTLTEAGKKRYSAVKATGGSTPKPRKAYEMTDDELRTAISRMQLEKQYIQLVNELHPDKLKRVKKMFADLAETSVKKISEKALTAAIEAAFKKREEEMTETDIDPKTASDKALERANKRLGNEETYRKLAKPKVPEVKSAFEEELERKRQSQKGGGR